MTESFSFDFDNEDIDFEDNNVQPITLLHTSAENDRVDQLPTQVHFLQDLLQVLPDRLSYTSVALKTSHGVNVNIQRRELFDIRAQLMAEDMDIDNAGIATPGLSVDDIVPRVYEGGFKTWECAIDLSQYMLDCSFASRIENAAVHVIELGAGTGLPGLTLLHELTRGSARSERSRPICVTLADYNKSVLELATIPNLLLSRMCGREDFQGDIECSSETIEGFKRGLVRDNIHISTIAGSWTDDFATLVTSERPKTDPCDTVILASETVYSPASTKAFTALLLQLLRNAQNVRQKATALIATKQMYFGVGGGLDDFMLTLADQGGKGSIVWESGSAGVGRSIIQVST